MMKDKMQKFWQNYKWLIIASVVFFVIYNFLNFNSTYHFNSPDETQYFNFAKIYAETWQMKYSEPLNQISNGLVRLRATEVIGDSVAPGASFGISMIYGLIAKFLGTSSIIYLTSILAIFGAWIFYFLVQHIFENKKIALISSLILLAHPAFWYYASRAMFNNLPMVVMVLAGIYFLLKALDKRDKCFYILSGIFVGLALSIRVSEIVWLFSALILILILNHRKVDWRGLALGILAMLISFSPILALNKATYGGYFNFGYNPASVSSGAQLEISTGFLNQLYHWIKLALVPFGFSLKNIWLNFRDFIWGIFWPLNLILIFGISIVIKNYRQINNKQKGLILVTLLISGLILLSYGSWYFNDMVGADRVTVGSAYLRYFLPIFLCLIPWMAYGIEKIKQLPKGKWASAILMIIVFVFGFKLVFLDSIGGLIKVKTVSIQNQRILEKVDSLTPDNSIFITGSLDKALFPEKKVIYNLAIDDDFEAIKNLLDNNYPVYWIVPTFEIETWQENMNQKTRQFGWQTGESVNLEGNLWLVEIIG